MQITNVKSLGKESANKKFIDIEYKQVSDTSFKTQPASS